MKPSSSVHNLSYHGNFHHVHEVIGGIHRVHRWSQRFSPDVGRGESTLVSLCWSTEQTLDFSSLVFDRGNHCVRSGMLLIAMSGWCIVDSVLSLARLC